MAKIGRPTKYNEENCIKTVLRLMNEGRSIIEVCASLMITRDTFYRWYQEKDKKNFKEAVDVGRVMSEAYWDDIGRKGTLGQIDNFKHAAWIYRMKCRFRDRWNEVREQKIELTNTTKELSKDDLEKKILALIETTEETDDEEDEDNS